MDIPVFNQCYFVAIEQVVADFHEEYYFDSKSKYDNKKINDKYC